MANVYLSVHNWLISHNIKGQRFLLKPLPPRHPGALNNILHRLQHHRQLGETLAVQEVAGVRHPVHRAAQALCQLLAHSRRDGMGC